MRTHIVLWKWESVISFGDRRYTYQHVNVMHEMLLRHTASMVRAPVRVVCVTDDPGGIECDTFPLWRDGGNLLNATKSSLPSCYRRLKLYDAATQRDMGIEPGDRVVSLDLDSVVCGDLRHILEKEGVFVGWKLAGKFHEEVYNGSFQMFTAGTLQHIWSEFDPQTSPLQAHHAGFLGSDQSWLSMHLVGKEGSTDIAFPEFASYPLHLRVSRTFTGKHRLVFFHGRQKPWSTDALHESPWIQRHWR